MLWVAPSEKDTATETLERRTLKMPINAAPEKRNSAASCARWALYRRREFDG